MDELLKRIDQLEVALQNEHRRNELLKETTSLLQRRFVLFLFLNYMYHFRLSIMRRGRFELEYIPYSLLNEVIKRVSLKQIHWIAL